MPPLSQTPEFAASLRREADLAACRTLLRHGSRTFHAASKLLPASVRTPATALYAFCRLADDAVDLGGGYSELADLHDRLERAYAGRPADCPVDRAFAVTAADYALPRALPEALFEGIGWDAASRRYETLEDLHAYAARVAGTVGAMMAVLMGVREPGALARACDLGAAMQLSNIARDVGEDARNGRLYLPRVWLREAGIDPEAFLAAPAFTPALGSVVQRLLDEADRLYVRSESGIARLPMTCRPAILAARHLYAEIGREVERAGCDSIASRAVVSPQRKARLLVHALAGIHRTPPGADEAPLAACRFLVEAVTATPLPRPTILSGAGLPERLLWVMTLFDRLERWEHSQQRFGRVAATNGVDPVGSNLHA